MLTARAELSVYAFTLGAPEDDGSVRVFELGIGKRLPRVTLPDFDYSASGARPVVRPEPPRAYRDPRRRQNQPQKPWRRSR